VAPGTNVILYNDSPAPVPAGGPRNDYYTGSPDRTGTGGAYQTLPGLGPNTRTVMQFRVAGTPSAPFNLANLQAALPAAYVASQPPPIVPETFYPPPYQAATDTYGHVNDTSLTFTPLGSTTPQPTPLQQKAIVEIFDAYGRMGATLGAEYFNPNAIPSTSTGTGFPFIDPPNEKFTDGETQIWKITHNGVDTHPIHFHLVNVQVINRVGWDGVIKPPDLNERGWKETIRMNPLEVIFIAMKVQVPQVPFTVPPSRRLLNPAMPLGSRVGFSNIDPATGNPTTTPTINKFYNFGHEYMWHCHILGHEENDMMRPLVVGSSGIITTDQGMLLLLLQ
jgi:FtsP/CotA-like multicopper oxidase with cupredoxin domain